MTTRWTLAIEGSQRSASVAAVVDALDESRTETEPLDPERRSDEDLLPAIDRLSKRMGLSPADLSTVCVSTGPGGFTGLRVSIATAKILGEFGAAVVPVPSAIVAAETVHEHGPRTTTLVVLAVKRGADGDTCWATLCVPESDGGWRLDVSGPAAVDSIDLDALRPDVLVCDDHLPDSLRRRAAGADVRCAPLRLEAHACLRAGRRLLESGGAVDPLALAPIYPRPPEAVTLWNARHGAEAVRGAATSENPIRR